MSARDDIKILLGEWLQLTRAETAAIQASEWSAVNQIQAAKSKLQRPVTDAMDKWSAEFAQGNATNHPFRAEVNDLISMEARNSELLALQMRRAETEKQCKETAVRNLRRVQKSYGGRGEGGWESFS